MGSGSWEAYYNDAVKPDDSYEFLGLLRHQPLIAAERNTALHHLAVYLKNHPALYDVLRNIAAAGSVFSIESWSSLRETLTGVERGPEFIDEFDRFCERYMDVAYGGEQLDARPDLVLHTVVEMAGVETAASDGPTPPDSVPPDEYEKRLLDAVGPERHDEARSVIEIGRLSWKLRDDDNVLLGACRETTPPCRESRRGTARAFRASRTRRSCHRGVRAGAERRTSRLRRWTGRAPRAQRPCAAPVVEGRGRDTPADRRTTGRSRACHGDGAGRTRPG